MPQNGPTWPKMLQSDPKWPKWPTMAINEVIYFDSKPFRPFLSKANGPKCLKMAPNASKWPKMTQNAPKWPKWPTMAINEVI